jgi:hypothetical protein
MTTLLLATAAGCTRVPTGGRAAGDIDLRWSGTQPGSLSGPATAEWCAVLRLLEIGSIRGDTGVALVLYTVDTIMPGTYRIVDPARAESLPPAGAIALRWPTQTAVVGFQGESGSVLLERTRTGELSGRLTAAARSANDTQQIAIEGTFRNITVRPQSRGCAPRTPVDSAIDAQPSDTQLH